MTSYAQRGKSGSVSGSFDVYDIQSISIVSLKGMVSFSDPNDYFGGQEINKYAKVIIKSNNNWQVSVSTQSTYFTPMTSSASHNMPSTILGIRVNGRANYKNMKPKSKTLKTGSRGGADRSGNTFFVDMKFNPGYEYNGGLYNIGLVYTLTRQ